MASFAGIPSLRGTLRLKGGVFFINWLKKNGPVQCSGRRDFGSSFPTRYIPKKSSKRNEDVFEENDVAGREYVNAAIRFEVSRGDKGGAAEIIYSNKEHWDRKDEWNLASDKADMKSWDEVWTNDGLMQSSCSEIDEMIRDKELLDDEWMKGRDVFVQERELGKKKDIHETGVLCNAKTRKDAENLAIRLLATRAYTAVEMKKKLDGKKFPPGTADAIIDDFKRRGLINDDLYAETFSQSRWSSSCWGPRRIKQELLRKGVTGVAVDRAVKQVFEGNEDSNSDEGSRVGLSKDSLDRLFTQASKQSLRSRGVPPETRKSRIVRWLQYRGFSWGVTNIILRRLEYQESSEIG